MNDEQNCMPFGEQNRASGSADAEITITDGVETDALQSGLLTEKLNNQRVDDGLLNTKMNRLLKNSFGVEDIEITRKKSDGLNALDILQTDMIHEPLSKLMECSDYIFKEQNNMNCWEENRRCGYVDAEAGYPDVVVSRNFECRRNNVNILLKNQEHRTQGTTFADIAIPKGGNDEVNGSYELKVSKCVSRDMGIQELKNSDILESMKDVEPLLLEMLNRPVRFDGSEWYDPVVVNETSRWILALCNSVPKSDLCSVEDAVIDEVHPTQIAPESSYQRKNPRGRPRKRNNHTTECLASSPPSTMSQEAQNT